MIDLLVTGGQVITMDAERRILADGAVAISGGRFLAVGETGPMVREFPAARRRLDARGKVVLPGLIDAHTHAGHALTKTVGSGNNAAWSAAVAQIYGHGSSADFWRASAALSALERLRFGVTTAVVLLGGGDSIMRGDDASFAAAHLEAVREIGVREILVLGHPRPPFPVALSSWSQGVARRSEFPFEAFLETCEAVIEAAHRPEEGRFRIALLSPVHHAQADPSQAPALFAATRRMRDLSRRRGVMWHQDGHRKGSIERLQAETGALGPDAWLSHCIDPTSDEVALLRQTDTAVVHNPAANLSMFGRCPVPELIDAGIRVMLGSDGPGPDRSTDPFRNMWLCMHYHRTALRDQQVLPPGKALELCTIEAARGLNLADELGSIEAGKRADLVTVDLCKPHLMPAQMPLHRAVCHASGGDVTDVVVDGVLRVESGEILGLDWRRMLSDAAHEAELAIARSGTAAAFETPTDIWRTRRG
ncbi:MAG: amidohydrolase family protein [Roseococcus sp.]|nr:amidohydrolase family protein [Roseococcus sp.]